MRWRPESGAIGAAGAAADANPGRGKAWCARCYVRRDLRGHSSGDEAVVDYGVGEAGVAVPRRSQMTMGSRLCVQAQGQHFSTLEILVRRFACARRRGDNVYSYRMIALVCTAVQEEVLGVRCKLMLQFLRRPRAGLTRSPVAATTSIFSTRSSACLRKKWKGVLTCRIAAAGGGLAVSCGGQPADIFDDVPSVSGSEDPPARLAAAAAAAAVMCIAHVLLQGAQQGASSEDGSR